LRATESAVSVIALQAVIGLVVTPLRGIERADRGSARPPVAFGRRRPPARRNY
jgi:hypothetical protein